MDDFSDLASKLPKIISETIDKSLLDDIGNTSVSRIRKRTRSGRGVKENDGPTHKLPALKPKTVKERSRLKGKGQLTGPGATPGRSGVNRSGKTLNEMNYSVVNRSEVEIKLSPTGVKRAQTVAEVNPDYEFMNLSKSEIKALVKIVEEKVIQVINKLKL